MKTYGRFQRGDAKNGKLAQKRLEGLVNVVIHKAHGTQTANQKSAIFQKCLENSKIFH
jgi:hypothetical protein